MQFEWNRFIISGRIRLQQRSTQGRAGWARRGLVKRRRCGASANYVSFYEFEKIAKHRGRFRFREAAMQGRRQIQRMRLLKSAKIIANQRVSIIDRAVRNLSTVLTCPQ